jgi:hypothetical protein
VFDIQRFKKANLIHFFLVFIWLRGYVVSMKHSESGKLKVLKQLRKCPEITEIKQTAKGHMVLADNGEQFLVHLSARAFHPLRRWLKANTSLKSLKF